MEKLNINLGKKLTIFTKRIVTTKLVGNYKSKIKGRGLEFSNFREYSMNDDSSLIDWKTSIRVNQPVVKEFVEERNLEVFFLIDVSSTMVFGSTEKLKNEYSSELISTLAYAILHVGDSLGYAFFSDKLFNLNLPAHSKNRFYILSRDLSNPENYGGTFDLELALKKVTEILRKNSVLIIVSDFIGLKGNWRDIIKKAAYKFDTIGIMVRDPRDREIPADSSMVVLSDPYTNQELILDPTESIIERYKRYVEIQEKEIESAFSKARASFLKLTTDQPFLVPLVNFFKKRQRWSK